MMLPDNPMSHRRCSSNKQKALYISFLSKVFVRRWNILFIESS